MNFDPITATAVQKIKRAAKSIAREKSIGHTAALEHAAKEAGFQGWYHVQKCQQLTQTVPSAAVKIPIPSRKERATTYIRYLANQPRSPAIPVRLKPGMFHHVMIEGQHFFGRIQQHGEMLIEKCSAAKMSNPWHMPEGSVYLGAASIRPAARAHGERERGWWVCKYDAEQGRISLAELSDAGRNSLAYEFGLPVVLHTDLPNKHEPWCGFSHGGEDDLFYESPAFLGLIRWAKKHPPSAKRQANKMHLKGWLDVAKSHPAYSGEE